MRILMSFLLACFSITVAVAQSPKVYGPEVAEDYKQKKRMFAIYSINKLKTGALLVRLQTRSKAIELYRKNGDETTAVKIEQDQTIENRNIIKAFRTAFTFCPVYFFYSSATDSVKKGVRSGYFLDDELRVDPTIALKEDFIMIAEYGVLESESFQFPQEGGKATSDHSGSLNRVLLVKDDMFVQMRDPFPKYVAGRSDKLKPTVNQVKKLNNALNRYYAKHATANPVYPFGNK